MTRLLLTSPNEKTVCADRDDRGGVLLTTVDGDQVYLTAEMQSDMASLLSTARASMFLMPTAILANLVCGICAESQIAPICIVFAFFGSALFVGAARVGHYDDFIDQLRANFGFSPRQSPTAERDAR